MKHSSLIATTLALMTSLHALRAEEARTADKHRYVFETKELVRYAFPTHINDLVIDRAASNNSEVFLVVVEPGKAPPLHVHHDTEQIFYVLEGHGILSIGDPVQKFTVSPGQVVRVPPHTLHSIFCDGKTDLRYLCVDCFAPDRDPKAEPTWEHHVKVVCKERGWKFEDVRQGVMKAK